MSIRRLACSCRRLFLLACAIERTRAWMSMCGAFELGSRHPEPIELSQDRHAGKKSSSSSSSYHPLLVDLATAAVVTGERMRSRVPEREQARRHVACCPTAALMDGPTNRSIDQRIKREDSTEWRWSIDGLIERGHQILVEKSEKQSPPAGAAPHGPPHFQVFPPPPFFSIVEFFVHC